MFFTLLVNIYDWNVGTQKIFEFESEADENQFNSIFEIDMGFLKS